MLPSPLNPAQAPRTINDFEVPSLPRAPLPKGYKLYAGTLPVDAHGSNEFFMYLQHPESKKLILWHNGTVCFLSSMRLISPADSVRGPGAQEVLGFPRSLAFLAATAPCA
jgi:hypothetical protein